MAEISDEAVNNRATLAEIKRMYVSAEITREQAKELAAPIIKRVNMRAKEIATLHNQTSYPVIDFISAMRNSY